MRKKQNLDDCELELLSFQASKIPYDITLDIIDDSIEGVCALHLIVRNDLYTEQQADTMVKWIVKLASSFARIPNLTLDAAAMFDAQEMERVHELSIGEWVPRYGIYQPRALTVSLRHAGPYPSSTAETVLDLIMTWAETNPSAGALKTAGEGSRVMSYASMMQSANTLAKALVADGCVKGSIVATYCERTPEWMCCVLGILRAGAICLPLDISLPVARLEGIVKHSEPRLIISQEHSELDQSLLETGISSMARIATISQLIHHNRSGIIVNGPCVEMPSIQGGDAAVVFYTSGSTGAPKGIIIHHGGLKNWTEAALLLFGTEKGGKFLQQTSCSFDMCFVQAFLALCSGGLLCLVPTRHRADATFITKMIAEENISFTGATPSEYANWHRYGDRTALAQNLPHWRTALAGGEPTTYGTLELFSSLAKLSASGARPRFFNVYGPTETTAGAVGTELDYSGDIKSVRITVGKPLSGYLAYILDANLQPVPVGVQGEIVIGGAGVAHGYVKDPELSSQRFLPNPLAPESYRARGWNTMHRTGDVGRWLEDGTMVIEGRKAGDTQIKLRGLRIDLAEVEHSMLQESDGALAQVVVTPRQMVHPSSPQEDNRVLVAFAKFMTDAYPTQDEQQAFLNELIARLQLPQYMRPAVAFPVSELPMLISGKLDRKAVAELPLNRGSQPVPQQPSASIDDCLLTGTESKLKDIWIACLSTEVSKQYTIGPSTDFFHIG